MKKETKLIKKAFEKAYKVINNKYPVDKPSLKVVHYQSGTMGFVKIKSYTITINSNYDDYYKTTIHEFCHIVNHNYFNKNKKKKIGHNTKFWELCYEFGLTEKDYHFGLTKTMEQAKKNIKKRSKK